jgi:transposase InsO family protein
MTFSGTWIFFMKTNDEVFSHFQEFIAQLENQKMNKIKVMSSYNGGEYTSNDFKDLFKERGINREMKVSYNPQQNGVAERKNRSIISSSKATIHDQGFPMFLWAETCNMVVYVQNKSHHRILGEKTPKYEFLGLKLKIGHLRIFDFQFYIHVPVEKRKILEPLG